MVQLQVGVLPGAVVLIQAPLVFRSTLAAAGRTPVYAVAITDGTIAADGSIGGATFITRICTSLAGSGVFSNVAETLDVQNIRRLSDPSEGRLELTSLTFLWVDEGGSATAAMSGLIDKTCILYAGFEGFASQDFVPIFAGVVAEAKLDERSGGFYTVTARSVLARVSGLRLFAGGRSRLVAELTADNVAGFSVQSAQGWEAPGVAEIGDELIEYAQLVATVDGWFVGGLTRGAFGTAAAVHNARAGILEVFRVGDSHIVQAFRDVAGGALSKKSLGLGAWLDDAALTALENKLTGGQYQAAWTVRRRQTAQDWLESEICLPLAAYLVDDNLGKIRIQLIEVPDNSGSIADSLTDSDTLDRPLWLGEYEERVNRVLTEYDGSGHPRSEFLATDIFEDPGLIAAASGRVYDATISALGVGAGNHESLLSEPPARRVERFGLAIPVIEVVTGMNHILLEVGDSVFGIFSGVPQLQVPQRGAAVAGEIIGIRQDFTRGRIVLKLLLYAEAVVYGDVPFTEDTALNLGGAAVVEFG